MPTLAMNRSEPRSRNILLLDDDEIVLLAIKETLERENLSIFAFNKPADALQALENHTFAVIISDHRMPIMTGLEFLAECKRLQPNASRILITGVLTLSTVVEAVNKGEIFRFLAKPWIREELLATVDNATQRFTLIEANEKLRADTLELNEQLVTSNIELEQNLQVLKEKTTRLEQINQEGDLHFRQSLETCLKIIEAFYPLLGQQTKAVITICKEISKSENIGESDKRTLTTCSWIYNLGRIHFPRELIAKSLAKPDALEPSEIDALRQNPTYAQAIAKTVDDSTEVVETIRAHRERFDGRGFPDRLTRDSIPIPARLLAVAIAYVESNLPKEQALEFLVRESGKSLHPEAVRIFMKSSNLAQLPKKVKEITLEELETGMILANNLFTPTGLLLVPEEKRLTPAMIAKIREHDYENAITQRLMIFR
ncbi:response regulator [Puniceicoccaceae bacterium K14]|nr:response regulator [Puniceicoccaceae bacterium K14]